RPRAALRHEPAARGRRRGRLVRGPHNGQDAAWAVRPDGAGQLLHGAQRRLPLPADRDLSALPGHADPHRRHAWTIDSRAAVGILDGGDRVVPRGPGALLVGGVGEAAEQLLAQVVGLDHGVDHELRAEVQDVDVLGVFGAQLLRATGALLLVLD